MSLLATWTRGVRLVRRAPALIAILWAASLAITIPPALFLHAEVRAHLGASLAANTVASGVNFDWLQEFREQATPLGRTLRPDVIGFGAVMENASALADASPRPVVLLLSGVAFVLMLWCLTAGIIHRLAIDRPLHARGFLGICGGFGVRMLRLNLVSALAYSVLFGAFHAWLFDEVFDEVTRDMTVERTAFVVRVVCYLVFLALAGGVNLLTDLAKVRLVVEDRHSVIAALAASARFIRRHASLAAGLYAANLFVLLLVIALYALVAPGAGSAGWNMWGGFIVGQVYIAARLAVKLSFWGSGVAALQSRLAYPGFARAVR